MKKDEEDFLSEAIRISKRTFVYVFLFSMAINLSMIALPIYTLQVLDRVISSASIETLVMLSIIIVVVLAALGAFSAVRGMVLVKLGEWFDKRVGHRFLSLSIASSAVRPGTGGTQNLRDVGVLKAFVSGPALTALFDLPWSIIYFSIIFMIHPVPGIISLAGGLVLFFAAVLNEKAVKSALSDANELNIKTMNHIEISSRNAEVIEAMGMMDAITTHWEKSNQPLIAAQALAGNRSAIISSFAKGARMILQIIIMGSGAYLVIHNQMTVGGMIASSILMGRALAPFEAAIGAWKSVTEARKSYERLKIAIKFSAERVESIDLPVPEGRLSVERIVYAIPGTNAPIIKGIGFQLNAGETMGVIGPSAAGKSTLAKLLVGVWRPNAGNVRLDGADVYTWNRKNFGQHVGYLPQDVELFGGTVRENIARMQSNVLDEDVVTAAQIAGAHDMILRLPKGYDTEIGVGGANLSAGQRQRVGLARAFFGKPKFLVLDEPNSNLDEAGEHALVVAMRNAKALKITSIVIAHRPTILNHVDKLLVLRDGTILDFGPAQELLGKYVRNVPVQPNNVQQVGKV